MRGIVCSKSEIRVIRVIRSTGAAEHQVLCAVNDGQQGHQDFVPCRAGDPQELLNALCMEFIFRELPLFSRTLRSSTLQVLSTIPPPWPCSSPASPSSLMPRVPTTGGAVRMRSPPPVLEVLMVMMILRLAQVLPVSLRGNSR